VARVEHGEDLTAGEAFAGFPPTRLPAP